MSRPEHGAAPPVTPKSFPLGLAAGVAVLIAVLLLPAPAGLPPAGPRMLAILGFAVVVWLTEAVSHYARAILVASLMAFLVGTAPTVRDPGVAYGTSRAIGMALAGFSNPALAPCIAAAITLAGLDRRIALVMLARIGTGTRRVRIGAIAVTILLWPAAPSAPARGARVVPIMMGVDKRSNVVARVMIVVVQATRIWNIGIQTAAAQHLLMAGVTQKTLGAHVSWASRFAARQFAKLGTAVSVTGSARLPVFGAAYWRRLGWL
ncbi:anion permease [Burkholderia glumae]|uniref:anion permease n=1 Tax=Burkholderia glumae TaxID=337 RepID=UPI0021646158|nr:anion permease [Burkholderia glumae]UVS99381.1 anion:sodium symporter [Burkholderia glumae]